jgi:hypothetical protein
MKNAPGLGPRQRRHLQAMLGRLALLLYSDLYDKEKY